MRHLIITSSLCFVLTVAWSPKPCSAANLITTNVVGANTGWNTANIWKTNGTGTAVTGPVAGNTYACRFNGVAFGNSTANTRMRNLYATNSPSFQTFPGDSLTLSTNTEFRFKRISASNIPLCNFPGVGGNPGLILDGGVLNVGDDGVFNITGRVQVASQSYLSAGDNGGGGTLRPNRGFTISANLSGSAPLVIFQSTTTTPHTISGTANTFSGTWIVKAGRLVGATANSLGTNSITLDPNYVLADYFSTATPIVDLAGPAVLEPNYDLNSAGLLTLLNGGRVRLHQNIAFSAVSIEGTPLSAGTHYYAELVANYPNNFEANGSGSITVQPYGPLPLLFTVQPAPQKLYAGRTAHFTARASGDPPITYQWLKNGAPLTDGGNIAGATTITLTISNVAAGDVASYSLRATNTRTTTSSAAALTLVTATDPYEVAVSNANPVAFYLLNETADPTLGTTLAFDFAGGFNGTYGTAVQNGFNNIAGPLPADSFTGFAGGNKSAQFANLVTSSRLTVSPWNLNTDTVTFTAWINPAVAQYPNNAIVFCRGAGTVAGLSYASVVDPNTGNSVLGYNWNNEGETYTWNSGLTPPLGQWSFVALVVTPTNATIHLMNTNGLAAASRSYTHVVQAFAGTTLIGDDSNTADSARAFSGLIDAVAVFGRALSKDELLALYSAAAGPRNYAPSIAAQPASLALYVGQTAQFTVAGGGTDPLSYQWKSGPSGGPYAPLSDAGRISGSKTATLTISNVANADSAEYIVTLANAFGSTNSNPATLTVQPTSPPENITMSVLQAGGNNWDTGSDWSDGNPASVSAAMKPGSTYELLPGARMRSPENRRTAVFPGNILTLDGDAVRNVNPAAGATISELRFKQAIPGTVLFKKLVFNGGQVDSGNDGVVVIGGEISILTNAPFNNDSGNDRGYQIDARLTGAGTIEYYGYNQSSFIPSYVNNLNITGVSNTFSGKWNVVLGTLLGTGTNALGTNDVTVGVNGAFETTYDVNNPNANLFLNGRMYLHQNDTFKSVFVGMMPLTVGTHPFAELAAAYPAYFPTNWTPQTGATNYFVGSGSLTVLVEPPPTIVQQPVPVSLYPTETAQFTVSVAARPPLTYQWRKGGVILTNSGNVSGAATETVTISNVGISDGGNYDVVVSNAMGSVTSVVAMLTLKPTGPALNLTLDYGGAPLVQPQGSDWNTLTNWSDGLAASESALSHPHSTYRVVAGARLRTPAGAAASSFPGEVLTVDGDGVWVNGNGATIGEIRFKPATAGTVYFKKLVMNGGQLDSAADANGTVVILGEMDILANTPLYNDGGSDRGFRIDAWLTGSGSIEWRAYTGTAFNPSYVHTLNIAGMTNTYKGTWNVVQGVLLGSGPNALGTNTITVAANGALETLYDLRNPQATLILDGQLFLHQNDMFRDVLIDGVALAPGTYSFAQLAAAFPAHFPATWTQQTGSTTSTASGSLTVLGATPPPVSLEFQVLGSTLRLNWSQGTLLEANEVTGPWTTNPAAPPFTVTPTEAKKFYRVQVQ